MSNNQKYERFVYYASPRNAHACQIGEILAAEFEKELPTLECVIANNPHSLRQAVEEFKGPLFLRIAGNIVQARRIFPPKEEISLSTKRTSNYSPSRDGYTALIIEGDQEKDPIKSILETSLVPAVSNAP